MQLAGAVENAGDNFLPARGNRAINFGSLSHLRCPLRHSAHESLSVSESTEKIGGLVGGLFCPVLFLKNAASMNSSYQLEVLLGRRGR